MKQQKHEGDLASALSGASPESNPQMGGGLSLRDWLIERKANCERIAQTKRGADRYGWLEDSQYFHDAISALDRLQAERELFARHVKERAERIATLESDAKRYRWLRDFGDITWHPISKRGITAEQCDAEIDAAIARATGADFSAGHSDSTTPK